MFPNTRLWRVLQNKRIIPLSSPSKLNMFAFEDAKVGGR